MSIERFIKDLQEEHNKEIEEFRKLQEILEQLQGKGQRITNLYVTSNL